MNHILGTSMPKKESPNEPLRVQQLHPNEARGADTLITDTNALKRMAQSLIEVEWQRHSETALPQQGDRPSPQQASISSLGALKGGLRITSKSNDANASGQPIDLRDVAKSVKRAKG